MNTISMLLLLLAPFFWEIVLSILLGVATIGAGIGMLGTSAYLIASAALHPSIAELQVAIVGVRFFGISRAGFRYLERLVSHSVNLRVLSRMRERFYRQVEAAPPALLHTNRSGDLLKRVMGDLKILENFYVRVVSPVVVALVVGTGVSFFIGGYGPRLGILLAAGLLLNGFVLPGLSIWLTRRSSENLVKAGGELSAQTVDFLQGLEDLQSNSANTRWMEEIKEKSINAGKWQIKTTLINGMNSGIGLLIMNLTVLGLLWMAIPLVMTDSISGVSLAVVLLMGMASFESVSNLPQAAVMLTASLESAKRVFAVDSVKLLSPVAHPQPKDWKPSSIKLEKISFDYEDNSFRLENVSFQLERGKKIAVIGPSGAGKTSLVNLLLHLWQPTGGRILFDEMDVSDLDAYQIRSCFAVISQNTWLFSANLRENLLLADPEANDQELFKILEKVKLGDWVKTLPQGLDTWMGDKGMRLSGGERQRVAIARALLQERPYLILDEPVENLDTITAKQILETIFDVFNQRGLLLITHDLSILGQMDEILVMEKGTIIDRGTQVSLLQKKGRFNELMEMFRMRVE